MFDYLRERIRTVRSESCYKQSCIVVREDRDFLEMKLERLRAKFHEEPLKQEFEAIRVERGVVQRQLKTATYERDSALAELERVNARLNSLMYELEDAKKAKETKEAVIMHGCDWAKCPEERYGGWRFCKDHLKEARKEMQEDGYLQYAPRNVSNRTPEMKEDIRMTKHGYDG